MHRRLRAVHFVALAALLAGCQEARFPVAPGPAGPHFDGVGGGLSGRIAFESFRDGDGEIYVMNPDGSGQTNLSNNAASEDDPVWSPDGTRITFLSTRDGATEIYVVNADGTGVATRLTNDVMSEGKPAWSPDGRQIAFVRFRSTSDEATDIYVMDPDGSGQTNLTNNAYQNFLTPPVWSPDGTRITFVSGNRELFVMNADGTGAIQLTTNGRVGAEETHIAWSPDGKRIAFESFRDRDENIFVVKADAEAETTQLTTNAFDDIEPAWTLRR